MLVNGARRRWLAVPGTVGVAIAIALFASCDAGPDFDRPAMLESLSDVVILPTNQSFVDESAALSSATSAFCATPSAETLTVARASWAHARSAYLRTEAHGFGPAMDLRIDGEVDFRPTRPDNIEAAIASGETFTDPYLDDLGVSAKGLPAMEYLLYPAGVDTDAVVTSLGESTRCGYLAALARHVARQATALRDAWANDYREAFVTAGHGSSAFMTEHAAVSALINRFLWVLEDIKLSRLGGPLGELEAAADPSAVESPYGGHDVAGMLATLRGLDAMWTGDHAGVEGTGVDALVAAYDPALADAFTREIDNAIGTMEAVAPPLSERIANGDTMDAEAAYLAIRSAERTLGTDVASTLAVTVTFTDNDGD